MAESTRRAIGYIRVSTSGQATEGESLGDQRQKIETWASAMGCPLVEVVEDGGESGKYFNRPGLQRVKTLAAQGKANTLIATKMTRLGRSARELLEVFSFLEEAGCQTVLLHENIDTTTPSGRLMRTMLAGIAEFEWETIREQTTAGRAKRRAAGIPVSLCPCYGYNYTPGDGNGHGRGLALNEPEAAVLRRAIAMILDGTSLRKTVATLNADGIRSKRGGMLSSVTLGSALSNPALYGKLYDGRWSYSKKKREGTSNGEPILVQRLLPESEWKFLKDVPAIIDRATWDRIQVLITDRNKARNVAENDPYILRDLLHCGFCSQGIDVPRYSKLGPKTSGKRRWYRCGWNSAPEAATRGREKCPMPQLPAEEVESIAWAFAKRVFLQPQVLIDQLASPGAVAERVKELEADLAGQKRDLAKVNRDEQKMAERLAEGDTPPSVAKAFFQDREDRRKQLNEQIDALTRQLSDQRQVLADQAAVTAAAGGVGQLGASVADRLDGLDNDVKKRLVRAVLGGARLVVLPYKPDPDHEGLSKTPPSRVSVGGTGTMAQASRWLPGPTVRTWRAGVDAPGPAWTLVLTGRINVGEVIERCARFLDDFREPLGITGVGSTRTIHLPR